MGKSEAEAVPSPKPRTDGDVRLFEAKDLHTIVCVLPTSQS